MVAGRREKCSLYKRVLENNDICSLYREGEGDCVNRIKFVCYAHIKQGHGDGPVSDLSCYGIS